MASSGLVVMGRDSRSKGRGFESRHRMLDVCLKRPKINEKEAGVGQLKKTIWRHCGLNLRRPLSNGKSLRSWLDHHGGPLTKP